MDETTKTSITPAPPRGSTQFGEGSYVKQAPRFSKQVADESRTNLFQTFDEAVLTEHQGLVELDKHLKDISKATKKNKTSTSKDAELMRKNLTFIGQKEYNEAEKAIAGNWKGYLEANPDHQIAVVTKITDSSGRHVFVKSDKFLFENVLSNFTDEELAKYKGRIVSDVGALTAEPANAKVVMLDDWTISGSQLEAAANELYNDPAMARYADRAEVHLITASPKRLASGLEVPGHAGTNIPVKAYYQAWSSPSSHWEDAGAHITGTHSVVDFDFSHTLAQFRVETDGKFERPALAAVNSSYRTHPLTLVTGVEDTSNDIMGKPRKERFLFARDKPALIASSGDSPTTSESQVTKKFATLKRKIFKSFGGESEDVKLAGTVTDSKTIESSTTNDPKPSEVTHNGVPAGSERLKVGYVVNVRASNGNVEGGWTVAGEEGDSTLVSKVVGGQVYEKKVDTGELRGLQYIQDEPVNFLRPDGTVEPGWRYQGAFQDKVLINYQLEDGTLRAAMVEHEDFAKVQFHPGSTVTVPSSEGTEGGQWRVDRREPTTGKVILSKKIDGKWYGKGVPAADLVESHFTGGSIGDELSGVQADQPKVEPELVHSGSSVQPVGRNDFNGSPDPGGEHNAKPITLDQQTGEGWSEPRDAPSASTTTSLEKPTGDLTRVVYHGSPYSFKEFDQNIATKLNLGMGNNSDVVFFSDSPHIASGYSGSGTLWKYDDSLPEGEGQVRMARLDLKNPYIASDTKWSGFISQKDVEALKAQGYDGVITDSMLGKNSGKEYIVFDKSQIHSPWATNSFDERNTVVNTDAQSPRNNNLIVEDQHQETRASASGNTESANDHVISGEVNSPGQIEQVGRYESPRAGNLSEAEVRQRITNVMQDKGIAVDSGRVDELTKQALINQEKGDFSHFADSNGIRITVDASGNGKLDFMPKVEAEHGSYKSILDDSAKPGDIPRVVSQGLRGTQNVGIMVDAGFLDEPKTLGGLTNERMAQVAERMGFSPDPKNPGEVKADYKDFREKVFSDKNIKLEDRFSSSLPELNSSPTKTRTVLTEDDFRSINKPVASPEKPSVGRKGQVVSNNGALGSGPDGHEPAKVGASTPAKGTNNSSTDGNGHGPDKTKNDIHKPIKKSLITDDSPGVDRPNRVKLGGTEHGNSSATKTRIITDESPGVDRPNRVNLTTADKTKVSKVSLVDGGGGLNDGLKAVNAGDAVKSGSKLVKGLKLAGKAVGVVGDAALIGQVAYEGGKASYTHGKDLAHDLKHGHAGAAATDVAKLANVPGEVAVTLVKQNVNMAHQAVTTEAAGVTKKVNVAGQLVNVGDNHTPQQTLTALNTGMGPGWKEVDKRAYDKISGANQQTTFVRNLYDSKGHIAGTQIVEDGTFQMTTSGNGSPYRDPVKQRQVAADAKLSAKSFTPTTPGGMAAANDPKVLLKPDNLDANGKPKVGGLTNKQTLPSTLTTKQLGSWEWSLQSKGDANSPAIWVKGKHSSISIHADGSATYTNTLSGTAVTQAVHISDPINAGFVSGGGRDKPSNIAGPPVGSTVDPAHAGRYILVNKRDGGNYNSATESSVYDGKGHLLGQNYTYYSNGKRYDYGYDFGGTKPPAGVGYSKTGQLILPGVNDKVVTTTTAQTYTDPHAQVLNLSDGSWMKSKQKDSFGTSYWYRKQGGHTEVFYPDPKTGRGRILVDGQGQGYGQTSNLALIGGQPAGPVTTTTQIEVTTTLKLSDVSHTAKTKSATTLHTGPVSTGRDVVSTPTYTPAPPSPPPLEGSSQRPVNWQAHSANELANRQTNQTVIINGHSNQGVVVNTFTDGSKTIQADGKTIGYVPGSGSASSTVPPKPAMVAPEASPPTPRKSPSTLAGADTTRTVSENGQGQNGEIKITHNQSKNVASKPNNIGSTYSTNLISEHGLGGGFTPKSADTTRRTQPAINLVSEHGLGQTSRIPEKIVLANAVGSGPSSSAYQAPGMTDSHLKFQSSSIDDKSPTLAASVTTGSAGSDSVTSVAPTAAEPATTWHANPNWTPASDTNKIAISVLAPTVDTSQILEMRAGENNNTLLRMSNGKYTSVKYSPSGTIVSDAGTWDAGKWAESGYGINNPAPSIPSTPTVPANTTIADTIFPSAANELSTASSAEPLVTPKVTLPAPSIRDPKPGANLAGFDAGVRGHGFGRAGLGDL